MNYKLLNKPGVASFLFALDKEKIKNILTALIVVLAVLGTFFYLFNKNSYQDNFFGSIFSRVDQAEQEEEKAESCQKDVYQEEAQAGEGLTHVARRVLAKHLEGTNDDFSAEHKVFMEDFIQKELGSQPLVLGEQVSISQDLISRAIQEAEKLTQGQLDNLRQYSSIVPIA
jgi:hypothetical protein